MTDAQGVRRALLIVRNVAVPKFNSESIFIRLLMKPMTQSIDYGKR